MKVKDIYTIELNDITNEEGVYDPDVFGDYDNLDEAILFARRIIKRYINSGNVIEATVYVGEWMDENGDVWGEPTSIYLISNSSPIVTAEARVSAGYCNPYVSEYCISKIIGWKPTYLMGKELRSIVIPSPIPGMDGKDVMFVDNRASGIINGIDGKPIDPAVYAFDKLVYGYIPVEWFDMDERVFIKLIREHFN